MFYRG